MAQGIQKGLAKIPLLWPFFEEVHIPDHQLQLGDLLQLSASKMEIFWKYLRSPKKIELKFQGKHGHTQHWLSMAIFSTAHLISGLRLKEVSHPVVSQDSHSHPKFQPCSKLTMLSHGLDCRSKQICICH